MKKVQKSTAVNLGQSGTGHSGRMNCVPTRSTVDASDNYCVRIYYDCTDSGTGKVYPVGVTNCGTGTFHGFPV